MEGPDGRVFNAINFQNDLVCSNYAGEIGGREKQPRSMAVWFKPEYGTRFGPGGVGKLNKGRSWMAAGANSGNVKAYKIPSLTDILALLP